MQFGAQQCCRGTEQSQADDERTPQRVPRLRWHQVLAQSLRGEQRRRHRTGPGDRRLGESLAFAFTFANGRLQFCANAVSPQVEHLPAGSVISRRWVRLGQLQA